MPKPNINVSLATSLHGTLYGANGFVKDTYIMGHSHGPRHKDRIFTQLLVSVSLRMMSPARGPHATTPRCQNYIILHPMMDASQNAGLSEASVVLSSYVRN